MKRAHHRWLRGVWTPAVCLGLAVVSSRAGGDPWVEVRSPHAIVVSDAGTRVAKRVAARFERFRAAIKVVWPWARVDPPLPPVILAPRDEGGLKVLLPEYWQTKGSVRPGGVFVGDLVHPWIALRADLIDPEPGRPNPYHLIQHEYVHLVIRLNFEHVPPWLNEGLAELFGGITVRGDGIVVGTPIESHVHLLRNRALLPVEKLFLVDYRSPEYLERERTSLFYAQSWAFAHFLVFDPKASRDPRFKGFVGKLVEGMEPAAALRAQGLGLPELDRALETYARQVAYRGTSLATRIEMPDDFQGRNLSEAAWSATCGAFLVHRGRTADGRPLLEQAERKEPELPAVQRALGLALYREGRLDEARERLERATRLDPADPTARLLADLVAHAAAPTAETRAAARANLEKTLELTPEHPVAHTLLAETLLAQGEVPRAVEHALRAARLEPGSGRHRLTLARALAAAGRVSEAKAQAEKAAGLGLDHAGNAAGLALLKSLAAAPEAGASNAPRADTSEEPSGIPGAIPALPDASPPLGRPAAWGVFVDPDGGSRLTERGGHIEIGVPAGAYDLSTELGKVNAPRLVRPVEGDFVAEVTVSRVPQPDRRQGLPGRAPFNGAGLLLWQDERNYVRLELGVYVARSGAAVRFALFEQRRDGAPVGGLSQARTRLEGIPPSLRLERRGRTLVGSVRQASGDWIHVGRFEADMPPTVYVGVAAVNASQGPFTAEFEGLTVVPAS